MNKSFDNGVQVVWDGTSLELAQTCARKYYFRMIRNIIPLDISAHLLFGGIYASSLELFYQLRAQGKTIEEATVEMVRHALIKSWEHKRDEQGNRLIGTGSPMNFVHNSKTRINLIRSLIWYIEEFGHENADGVQTYILKNGKAAVELSFILPLTDDIMYAGHLDRVVSFGDDLFWMDQKTTGQPLSTYYFDQYTPGNQFSGYTWAGQIVLKSPVKGGIIDAAQVAVGFTRFSRGFVHRSKEEIEEWLSGTIDSIHDIQRATEMSNFRQNPTACGNYGGCPYRAICRTTPSMREHVINSHYQSTSDWDPSTPR